MSDTAAPSNPAHRLFSFGRVAALAGNTLRDLVRQKVFYFMLVFALILIGASLVLVSLSFQGEIQTLKDVGLGAISVFTTLLAVLSSAMLLPKDIEDRTLYTILAKPVTRFEYLLGKLTGVIAMLATATILMTVCFCGVLKLWQGRAIDNIRMNYPADLKAESIAAAIESPDSTSPKTRSEQEIQKLKSETFNGSLFGAIGILLLRAAVCAAVTLMVSCFATSWLFTVVAAFMMILIGHIVPIARDAWQAQAGMGMDLAIHIKLLLMGITVFCPDMQLFNLVDDIAVGKIIPMEAFMQTTALGLGYLAVYVFVGYLFFAWREL